MKLKCLFFLLLSCQAHAQHVFKVSLAEHYIPEKFVLKISEVIDGRKDRSTIGLVQRWLNNRKALAVFKKPGFAEIDELLMPPGSKAILGL